MEMLIKQFKTLNSQNELTSLLLISTLSIIIWFTGPLIAIANTIPLAQPEKRFYIIALFFIGWFFKIYYFSPEPRQIPFIVPNLELVKKIQALEEKFGGFVDFLKKTIINKQGTPVSLINLPWYLVLGPSGSGKTSLLANANVNFLLSKKFKNENLKTLLPSSSCDWWVTRDLVLVDVPGVYLNSKQKKIANSLPLFTQSAPGDIMWRSFLNLVKKFRGLQNPLSGVVITLSLADLMSPQKQNREHSIHGIKQRISELRAQFGEQIPFYLTITKCDMMPGFTEFFSDSGSDEISQMWGVSIPELKENEKLIDVFTTRFNGLIKRLNSQLITRLHQERNPATRPYIKDFPLHIERLKTNITNFLKIISQSEKNLQLHGLYLTSAVQHAVDEPIAPAYNTLPVNKFMPAIVNLPMPSKPYFVRQLLLQGLLNNATQQTPQIIRTWQHRPLVYTLAAGLVLLAAIVLGVDFDHNIQQTHAIQRGLDSFQSEVTQQDLSVVNALPLLNALEQTANAAHSWFFQTKAEHQARAAYNQATQKIVFAEIKHDLEAYLENTNDKNPAEIYSALKAYLMLNNSVSLNQDFMIATMQQVAPVLYSDKNSGEILHHTRAAFNKAREPLAIKDDLVANVRKHLLTLSPLELSYVIMQDLTNTSHNESIEITMGNSKVKIPVLFSQEFFTPIYNLYSVNAVTETVEGNAVLGKFADASIAPNNAPLIEQLRTLYVTNYANTWENLLNHAQLSVPSNLKETDALISTLAQPSSPLLQLLKTIQTNTSFAPVMSASPKLATLNTFLANLNTDNASKLTSTLLRLHVDLQKILTPSDDNGNAAFLAAAARMTRSSVSDPITQLHQLAESAPAPLKIWINNLASQTWHYTLQEASRYIEARWQTDIMKTYRADFAERYPFSSEATQEVSVDEFSKVFNPRGTVMVFYQNFLLPFISISNNKLQWKKVENEQIPLSATTLAEIQKMQELAPVFFPDNENKLAIKFTLQPLSLSKNIRSITLNIQGQNLQFDRSLPQIPTPFEWPGNRSTHETKLNLLTLGNQPINSNFMGDWGLFRLMSASMEKTVSPRQYVLNFDVYGYQAKYFLFIHGSENPFVALQGFKLSEQL